jgi:NAD-dependent SIR2 family protein deacetylase
MEGEGRRCARCGEVKPLSDFNWRRIAKGELDTYCRPCRGEADPLVLEFDHIKDKSFEIGAGLPDRNWESILTEIEKCEVVCANCHRRRTANRFGTVRG